MMNKPCRRLLTRFSIAWDILLLPLVVEKTPLKPRDAYERNEPFSAVVMDLALPGGISGLEATIAIKQIDGRAKIIVSSGYLEQNARGAALEHGFAGILPKPYTAERLSSELRWVLKKADEKSEAGSESEE